ncbi:MAG: amino acid adenylation domain-containing protein [Nostoc sp. NOS(2021)]|uniref:non-ribosomal peptide synthetase n=1 Tax=Nostoc sp. NOS(2021) TaxID=2815407 RepID=UPI0025DEE005|nr:non-ribosomal peptide synthetase [Nostoc sp. NOS(2021)]MBN3897507.1 amino acid adenylation domain-containing protein [Nostoc sp. NOS(2021)]
MTLIVNNFQEISYQYETIVDILRYRSLKTPHAQAFTFLEDGETQESTLTYHELDQRSRAIAAQLQALGLSGERAILFYSPGLEYVTAFFGCLYAKVVAIPAYLPHNQRKTSRIQAIITDAQAAICLTTTTIFSKIESLLVKKTDQGSLRWLTTDNLAQGIEDSWQQPVIDGQTLAFLQYTSGSTGTPKGVMLSHGNLLHNAAMTYQMMGHSPKSQFISWLPVYHDMGLIGGILQPLYGGFPCVLMSPASFLQRPYRWLQAISRYRGTTSGGPNFAYEQCIQRITPQQRSTLDLSSWSVAFNGAEPIRQKTLERFAATFADCGFRLEAFYPCYGMAEATLMVSGGIKNAKPAARIVAKAALEKNLVVEVARSSDDTQTFVGCGQTLPQQKIAIAHPDTLTTCQPDEVGEIWVSGLSIGQGYWNRPVETEETFYAYLKDTGHGPFLRTGDLGFLHNGELFITGRAKDLIIIRGRNLYPQDIELTVERSHSSLRSDSGAAFSLEIDNEERLVVVQELEFRAKPNLEEVIAAIRQAVTEEHEIQAYVVVLVKPGTIPKTSSGKIRRRATKEYFLTGKLDVVSSSIQKNIDIDDKENRLQRQDILALTPRESQPLLQSYLQEKIARVLAIPATQISFQQPLSSLGLDSIKVFELKNRIEVDLEVAVSIADFFEGLSLQALATKILAELTSAASQLSVSLNPIQKITKEVQPLSFAQQRLWFINQLEPGNLAYNISLAINLKGQLKVTLLEHSLNEIVRRHETLRTTFTTVNGQPVQVIAPSLKLSISVVDCQKIPGAKRETEVRRLATQQSQQSFDLAQGPLLRARVLCLSPQEHILLLVMHHIISDAWSVEILMQEMASTYKAFLTESFLPLPDLSIQYKDFAYWQRQRLQGEVLQAQLSYWKQQLEDAPTILQLPTDRPRPAIQTSRGSHQSIELSKTLSEQLKAIARQEGVTQYMLLLAAFQTFLYRYTGQDDILVGSPVANRNHNEIKGLIGFFVNTLVLRTSLSGNPSFQQLLNRVRKVALEAYTHQDIPFDQLVRALQPERNVSYTPVFQVMFDFRNAPPLPEMPNLTVSQFQVENETAQFDLSLSVEITESGMMMSFEYNTDLFNGTTIAQMLEHFQNLLFGIVANPQARLSDLPLLTEAQQHQLLVEFNTTRGDFETFTTVGLGENPATQWLPNPKSQREQCIHQLFEAQVERTPDAIAVIFPNQQYLTYQELNQRANQLAHHLQKLGVGPEVLVGICVERSLSMVVGLLAILKAGGAYVPLDPTYPQQRLASMLMDAKVPVILTSSAQLDILPKHESQVVCLDADWMLIAQESQENPIHQTKTENLAYLIYTSGSTGTPKGVMIQHQSLVNYTEIACLEFGLKASERVLQFASISFDTAAEEIFPCLVCGAALVLRTDDMLSSTSEFLLQCHNWGITVLDLPTAFWHQLVTELATANLTLPDSLRLVIIGGETAKTKHLETWLQHVDRQVHLINSYGPTETTIVATLCELSASTACEVPIGRAIANIQTYVLDPYLQLVPIGTPGELYIGGVGVARGYLNRPDLTAGKFIPNPYSSKPGERLYQTGDLVRYLSDGNLEFLGRIDHQVKIRGFRIELGEIEALLNQHPIVRQAVVIAHDDGSDHKRLVAYIVGQGHLETAKAHDLVPQLRDFLREKLPKYMVPTVFMFLDTLPLTLNGKVNHRVLPPPEADFTDNDLYVAPQTELEQIIASTWQTVLGLKKVSINDNFFDLGGHSLLISQVNAQLREQLQRDISVVEMFQYPSISLLAKHLSQEQQEQHSFKKIHNRSEKQKLALNRQKQTHKSRK